MEREASETAYGMAAFEVMKLLVEKLAEHDILAKPELLSALSRLAQQASARGLALNSDAESGSALLIARIAQVVRQKLS